ncbi:Ent-kaurene synthase [Xylaria acuta]|nr:Ent-kaurene synthase [Xylaria acuta]
MSHTVEQQAQSLLERLALRCCSSGQGYGSISASIYDTAWLSMLQKPRNSGIWLFPESFEYILKHQLDSGGWPCYESPVDRILNTASALLSLQKHLEIDPQHQDWMLRSRKAQSALQQMLDGWDISVYDQERFGILVVNHLSLLHNAGLNFEFSQLGSLKAIRDTKLAKLLRDEIHQVPSSSYGSLEAFIGHIDFDRVCHWLDENGSIMGSPASTAAYLMHASVWDDAAELYLRDALNHGLMDGSVPCAWPTTIFEVSWAATALLEAGIAIKEIEASKIANFLEEALDTQSGTVGFAPSIPPDADDTARAILALAYMGKEYSLDRLIKAFEGQGHFKTYEDDRNTSFSTNCNIIICLLTSREPGAPKHASQVAKAARFLCDEAFHETVNEKRHKHKLYWMMLLSQAILKLYEKSENIFIQDAIFQHDQQLHEQLPMISIQVLRSILLSQQVDGSWDNICEVTAYSILTLSHLSRLPWIQDLDDPRIILSIQNGKSFLEARRREWSQGHFLWIEKGTYASDILSEAYCLAAAAVPIPSPGQIKVHSVFLLEDGITKNIRKARYLLEATSIAIDGRDLRIAERQACYALIGLRRRHREIFPAPTSGKDRYMGITALIWIACSLLHQCPVSLAVLCELMALSMFVYQVDEFMESVVEKECGSNLSLVKKVVRKLCSDSSYNPEPAVNDLITHGNRDLPNADSVALERATDLLGRFISYFRHPAVVSSPAHLQTRLAVELETFLLAHITHAEDNLRLQKQGDISSTSTTSRPISEPRASSGAPTGEGIPLLYRDPGRTFFNWVHSTSADDTSCPLSFIFYSCVTRQQTGADIFTTPRAAYVAEDMCRHLSSMCRMYNDYGSAVRDRAEGNLNSLNFPEFHGLGIGQDDQLHPEQAMQKMKDELMWIAEYERRCLDAALAQMSQFVGQRKLINALELYIDVTDMYGRVYLLKDLTNRVK